MSFDVAARLAEGRTAVTNTQVYVDACRAVGYQNADLTARGGQVDEWYATEDGLDLAALDADCATLLAAAGAAAEALRIERAGMAAMASAWSGDSGGLAGEFVERHCSAGAAVVDAVRSAAETCTALRDRLWVLINGKADTATAIDDRRAGERVGWLAAAHSVTTGASDRDDAVEIVKQRILPYVDGDIRADWVGAMRSATKSVDAAYDEAAQALGAYGSVDFAVPTQLGPPSPSAPAPHTGVAQPRPAAITTPAAASAPAVAPSAPAPDFPSAPPIPEMPAAQPIPAAPPMTPPAADLASPFGAGPGAGAPAAGGAGLGSGGGLSTLVSEIIDALGSLFDDPTDDPTDEAPDGPLDATIDDPADSPAGADAADQDPDERSPAVEPLPEAESPVPQPVPIEPDSIDDEPVEPEPEPEEPPVIPPPAAPEPDPRTPCDIAADELPQVGQ